MKTIERRFLAVRKRNANLGDYPTLYKAVKGAEFKETTISKWFSILVSKDEYDLQDRRQLVKQLAEASSATLRTALLS